MRNKLSAQNVKDRFLQGSTQQEISELAGVSRQRIQQILASYGLRAQSGGASLRETVLEQRARASECRCHRLWDISIQERNAIRDQWGYSPFRAFSEQRTNSKRRGIPFLLSFRKWWDIWQQSGHWPERGQKNGTHLYVMSRFKDKGAYEDGNVHIVTQSDNMKEYLATRYPHSM